jgi:uncharacterized protein YkwD
MIDLLIIVFLAAWIAHGYRRGFLISFTDLLVFVVSIYLATETYPTLSTLANESLSLPRSYANLLSFLILFGTAHFLLGILSIRLIYPLIVRLLAGLHLRKIDRFAGVLPAAIGGILWLSITLGILSWFPVSTYIKSLIDESRIGAPIVRTASIIQPQAERIAGKAIEDTIGFITTKRDSGEEWRPNIPADARVRFDPAAETYMLLLVNREREVRGLRILAPDLRLRDVARAHSMDMVKHNFFDHKSPTTGYLDDRLLKAGIFYLAAGENLAYAQDIELAHTSLMESKGHRENILRRYYGKAGIGIVNAGQFGYMCTQVFTN